MTGWKSTMRDENLRKIVGSRIKELRKKRRWTQKELAQKIGIHFLHLNKYEGGQHMPPLERLALISEILDTSIDYLVFGKDAANTILRSRVLLDRFKLLEELPQDDQATVVKLVDAMIAKAKLQQLAKEVA